MRIAPPGGDVKAADEADDGRFARAGRADQRSDGAGLGLEGDPVEYGLAGLVLEGDVVETDVAVDVVEGMDAGGLAVFLSLVENLGGAVETGQRLGELRPN